MATAMLNLVSSVSRRTSAASSRAAATSSSRRFFALLQSSAPWNSTRPRQFSGCTVSDMAATWSWSRLTSR